MTPKYSSPIRVTWSVPADPQAVSRQLARLAEGRVLFVEAEIDEASASVLGTLAASLRGTSLSVMGSARALAVFAEHCENSSKVEGAVLYAEGLAEELRTLNGKFKALSVAVWSTDGSLAEFEQALGIAAEFGLRLLIPNPHFPARALSRETRNMVAEGWLAAPVKPAATVHDLFLSEAMGINPWRSYTGCAAGSALAHLAADGTVTACRTMPTELGDLNETPLKEIWSGEAATRLREQLSKAPSMCLSCALAEGCKGGCPGLAAPGGRDGSCEGPREGQS